MAINRVFTDRIASSNNHVRTDRATVNEQEHRGLHELLRRSTVHRAAYDYIADNPDCTRGQVCEFVVCNWRRITDLITEGLVFVSGKRGNKGTLRVVEGGSTGRRRDLLHVEFEIYVNKFGEYSVEAKLVGQLPGAKEGEKALALREVIPIRVPRPQEQYMTRVVHDAKYIDLKPTSVVISK